MTHEIHDVVARVRDCGSNSSGRLSAPATGSGLGLEQLRHGGGTSRPDNRGTAAAGPQPSAQPACGGRFSGGDSVLDGGNQSRGRSRHGVLPTRHRRRSLSEVETSGRPHHARIARQRLPPQQEQTVIPGVDPGWRTCSVFTPGIGESASNPTKHASGRFGLGRTCRPLKLLGGTATIDSEPGKGTYVNAEIPPLQRADAHRHGQFTMSPRMRFGEG